MCGTVERQPLRNLSMSGLLNSANIQIQNQYAHWIYNFRMGAVATQSLASVTVLETTALHNEYGQRQRRIRSNSEQLSIPQIIVQMRKLTAQGAGQIMHSFEVLCLAITSTPICNTTSHWLMWGSIHSI